MTEEIKETWSSYGPECPHCGHQHEPKDSGDYVDDDEFPCAKCGEKFEMEVSVMHVWECRVAVKPSVGNEDVETEEGED